MTCRHLKEADEAEAIGGDGATWPVTVLLCSWADSAPPQMLNVPRWMQRNALSGHLWREGDCDGCPCFSSDHG